MKQKLILIGALVTGLVVAALIVSPSKSSQMVAQSIPDGAYFSDAIRLSTGKKQACLPNNPAAEDKVNALKAPTSGQSFDLILGSRIIDVPAGTIDTTVNSFDGTNAAGTVTYSNPSQAKLVGDLKNFNYSATVDKDGSWKMDSFIACE